MENDQLEVIIWVNCAINHYTASAKFCLVQASSYLHTVHAQVGKLISCCPHCIGDLIQIVNVSNVIYRESHSASIFEKLLYCELQ